MDETGQKIIDAAKKELAALASRKDKLFDYFERDLYSEDEFIQRKKAIDSKISALQQEIHSLERHSPNKIDYREKILQFQSVIDALNNQDISGKEKNYILRTIIDHIDYDNVDGVVSIVPVLK